MNYLDVLELLEKTKGSNEKKKILKENRGNPQLTIVMDYALSFSKKFYIRDVSDSFEREFTETHSFTEFIDLLEKLMSREHQGNEAKGMVELFLTNVSRLEAKWFARVINKDLKIGISVDTAIACGYDIENFDVMLATDGKKSKKLNSIIEKGVLVTPKLDGYRCIAIWDGEDVELYSRNGSKYVNFPTIEAELRLRLNCCAPVVLDGEIMSDDFQSMQKSAFASVRGTTVGDVVYHVFDIIDYHEWESRDFRRGTENRHVNLKLFIDNFFKESNLVQLVESHLVFTLEDVLLQERMFSTIGFEGAMILPRDLPYYLGRKANSLMKFKTMVSDDCEVLEIHPGTGRLENTMGYLTVKQPNGKVCGVGSGFSDAERDQINMDVKTVIGRIAEIKYQDLTEDGIMRFPVFVRWRDNESGGKI